MHSMHRILGTTGTASTIPFDTLSYCSSKRFGGPHLVVERDRVDEQDDRNHRQQDAHVVAPQRPPSLHAQLEGHLAEAVV